MSNKLGTKTLQSVQQRKFSLGGRPQLWTLEKLLSLQERIGPLPDSCWASHLSESLWSLPLRSIFPQTASQSYTLELPAAWLYILHKDKTYLRFTPLLPPPITHRAQVRKLTGLTTAWIIPYWAIYRTPTKQQPTPLVPNTAKFGETWEPPIYQKTVSSHHLTKPVISWTHRASLKSLFAFVITQYVSTQFSLFALWPWATHLNSVSVFSSVK